METINGKIYYDSKELSDKLDKVILEQSKILSKNLYTLKEAQKIGTKIIKKRSNELKIELINLK